MIAHFDNCFGSIMPFSKKTTSIPGYEFIPQHSNCSKHLDTANRLYKSITYIQIFQIEISLLWKEAKVLESNIPPFCLIKEFLGGEEVSENEEVNDFQIIILVRSITLSRRRN